MVNPYNHLYDWASEEEIDIEAMTEAIQSLLGLGENLEKIKLKIIKLDGEIDQLRSGKSSIKSIFSFKSRGDDIDAIINEKSMCEKHSKELDSIIKIAIFNMRRYIEEFKQEKLSNYYVNLKKLSELQMSNSIKMNDFWDAVSKDKNIKNLNNS